MNDHSIEARLLALEVAVKALIATHPNPQEGFFKFNHIFPEIVRGLNKRSSPEKANIAKELVAECNILSNFFPKK